MGCNRLIAPLALSRPETQRTGGGGARRRAERRGHGGMDGNTADSGVPRGQADCAHRQRHYAPGWGRGGSWRGVVWRRGVPVFLFLYLLALLSDFGITLVLRCLSNVCWNVVIEESVFVL